MYIEIFSDSKRESFTIGDYCDELKSKIKCSRDFLFNYFNLKDRKFYFIELENSSISNIELSFKVSPNHMVTIEGTISIDSHKLMEFERDPYNPLEDLDDNESGSIELNENSFKVDNDTIIANEKKLVSIERSSVIIDKDREEAQCKFIQNLERRRNDK